MLYTHTFNGVTAKTGDVLFTHDGEPGSLFGKIWELLGHILPGDLDHCAIYLGPGLRFIESAARGVVVVEFAGDEWNAAPYGKERLLLDELVGIGDAIAGRDIPPDKENEIREQVVSYCLEQAKEAKPYNVDFFDPETDGAFYCSQLVYKAYELQGIDLHPPVEGENLIQKKVVLPEDVWNACKVRARVDGK